MRHDLEFTEGICAFACDEPRAWNPYAWKSPAWYAWEAGWAHAKAAEEWFDAQEVVQTVEVKG